MLPTFFEVAARSPVQGGEELSKREEEGADYLKCGSKSTGQL